LTSASIEKAGSREIRVKWNVSGAQGGEKSGGKSSAQGGAQSGAQGGADFDYFSVSIIQKTGKVVRSKEVNKDAREAVFSNMFTGHYKAKVTAHKSGKTQTKSTREIALTISKIPEKAGFVDLSELNDNRRKSIDWLFEHGITTGSPQGSNTYSPLAPVNRGAMAQFMRRAVNSPGQVKQSPAFIDLGTGIQGRDDDIKWLASEGITTGSPAGSDTYRPADTVSRGAMAEFLYKLAGSPSAVNPDTRDKKNHHVKPSEVSSQEKKFAADSDLLALKNENPNRYYDILWLAKEGITIGSTGPDGLLRYNPLAPVNRGAMAEFLKKLYELL
jgi:hypothetical protein